MIGHDAGDEFLVALDLRAQQVELLDEEQGELAGRGDEALVGGDRDRCCGGGDARLDDGLAAALVGVIELAQRGGGGRLERREVGELRQEAAGERGGEALAAQLQGLRVVGF